MNESEERWPQFGDMVYVHTEPWGCERGQYCGHHYEGCQPRGRHVVRVGEQLRFVEAFFRDYHEAVTGGSA
jgi:hypothetical protein